MRGSTSVAGWLVVGLCVLYGGFALAVGVGEGLDGAPTRSAPALFVLHAVTGTLALLAGVLQLRLAGPLLRRRPAAHRVIGRLYCGAALATSLGSGVVAAFFPVGLAARSIFWTASILWFGTTVLGYRRIRAGQVRAHREWMIRSYALAFFFVTFSLWVPVFASLPVPQELGYPIAVLLSWGLNLIAAELWIRRARSQRISTGVVGSGGYALPL